MKTFFALILASILIELSVTNAQVIDSSFFRWTVYELEGDESEERKCYMITNPTNSESDQPYRAQPYIIITRYQNRRIEEMGVNSGFDYKINGKVLVTIDDARLQLSTNRDMAWASNKNEDAAIIQKMLNSAIIKVRADSAIGTFAIDEYSMKGIAKAYSRMRTICK